MSGEKKLVKNVEEIYKHIQTELYNAENLLRLIILKSRSRLVSFRTNSCRVNHDEALL